MATQWPLFTDGVHGHIHYKAGGIIAGASCRNVPCVRSADDRKTDSRQSSYLPMHGTVNSRDSVTKLEPAAMTKLTMSFSEQVSFAVVVCSQYQFSNLPKTY